MGALPPLIDNAFALLLAKLHVPSAESRRCRIRSLGFMGMLLISLPSGHLGIREVSKNLEVAWQNSIRDKCISMQMKRIYNRRYDVARERLRLVTSRTRPKGTSVPLMSYPGHS
jgi:hypothetical protein